MAVDLLLILDADEMHPVALAEGQAAQQVSDRWLSLRAVK